MDKYHHGKKKDLFDEEFLQACKGVRVYKSNCPRRPVTKEEFTCDHSMTKASRHYVKTHSQVSSKKSRIISQVTIPELLNIFKYSN